MAENLYASTNVSQTVDKKLETRKFFNGHYVQSLNINSSEHQAVKSFFLEKTNNDNDESDTRLESDEEAVKILTIHKSQGSEFPIVIVPMTTQHFTLLERNLLYTAVTRGKRMVILLAQKKALAIALNTTKAYQRHSLLQARLQQQSH